MAAGPVTAGELDRLFAPVIAYEAVGLAVSGGPDSTALMHLFALWQAASAGPRAIVLTVDHGLRPEAAAEAQAVVEAAKQRGFDTGVLRWVSDKPATGLQEAAREARYRLLGEAALAHGLDAVLTAHTEDDQAETLLMRLARGSGLDGLAAMPIVSHLGGLTLVRPLLRVPKARLLATLADAGIGYASDPTNLDPRFERTRLRIATPVLEGLGLSGAALARTARRLERARCALEAATDSLAQVSVTVSDCGAANLDVDQLAQASEEIAVRLVDRIVSAIGGEAAPLSLAKVEALTSWLRTAVHGGRTLGRTEVRVPAKLPRRAIFLRESRRRPLPEAALAAGASILWDGRFRISLSPNKPDVQIRACRPDGGQNGGKVRQSVPIAWRDGGKVASPLDPGSTAAAGLTFDFTGRPAIFGARWAGETQK